MSNVLSTSDNNSANRSGDNTGSKIKVSFLGIVLTIILAVVVILLGERIMFDLNRYANPAIEQTVSQEQRVGYSRYYDSYKMDSSSLSGVRLYYSQDKAEDYRLYKLLIHAAFVLPVFLLFFLIYFRVGNSHRESNWRVVVWGYLAGVLWLLLHLIGEAGVYVVDAYKNAAIYVILIFLAIILTSLAVFMQKKKQN